jgi:hypothetical protein
LKTRKLEPPSRTWSRSKRLDNHFNALCTSILRAFTYNTLVFSSFPVSSSDENWCKKKLSLSIHCFACWRAIYEFTNWRLEVFPSCESLDPVFHSSSEFTHFTVGFESFIDQTHRFFLYVCRISRFIYEEHKSGFSVNNVGSNNFNYTLIGLLINNVLFISNGSCRLLLYTLTYIKLMYL